jgi:hypothetical protein
MLKEYENQQAALRAQREAEERARLQAQQQAQLEFEQRQREQAERERMAQEQLMQQQAYAINNQAQQHVGQLEQEILAMRGQYERDQLMLEQYDRVRKKKKELPRTCRSQTATARQRS